ncbi:MAG TPA: flavodoxin-dependent (E)-4-hydroxy-3-methylbut-2-enyl-diphosphate synthase [Candidatus Glassbacteria bacterium]|nr:flavodoxin-dependent (E)-4-hydroxy-3-methylbut-2-enyl-diphosphate synthase [Candidatus Glassbacteria bacterium]
MREQFTLSARRKTISVKVGQVGIGSEHPVAVQSMTNSDTRDPAATLAQIRRLAEAGCEVVRVAVPDKAAAGALPEIVRESPLPVVADIHFNYRLALAALDAGVAKLRINPGNIGGAEHVRALAEAAGSRGVPIRVGVNSGSLEKELLERFGGSTPEALCESALGHCRLLEDAGFTDIVVSLKASDVPTTVRANRLFAARTRYPLHLGVTEAGTRSRGTVLSSVGIGILLAEGIGDTLRVSLTADPEDEITVAYQILSSMGVRSRGAEIISCPSCGRTEVDLIGMAEKVEKLLRKVELPIKVAVMGCVVNGPGEAREADFGIAAGKGNGIVFRRGEPVCRVKERELIPRLLALISEETGITVPLGD